MPNGWLALDDEQLSATIGISLESAVEFGMELSPEALEAAAFYVMMAIKMLNSSNIIVGYENLSALATVLVNEEMYLENVKAGLGEVANTTFGEITESVLGETPYYTMPITMELNGISVNQSIFVRKVGNRVVVVNITAMGGDLEEILACFK